MIANARRSEKMYQTKAETLILEHCGQKRGHLNSIWGRLPQRWRNFGIARIATCQRFAANKIRPEKIFQPEVPLV